MKIWNSEKKNLNRAFWFHCQDNPARNDGDDRQTEKRIISNKHQNFTNEGDEYYCKPSKDQIPGKLTFLHIHKFLIKLMGWFPN